MTGATDLGAATSHNIGLSSFPGNTSLIETLDSAFTVLAEVDCIYLRKKKKMRYKGVQPGTGPFLAVPALDIWPSFSL